MRAASKTTFSSLSILTQILCIAVCLAAVVGFIAGRATQTVDAPQNDVKLTPQSEKTTFYVEAVRSITKARTWNLSEYTTSEPIQTIIVSAEISGNVGACNYSVGETTSDTPLAVVDTQLSKLAVEAAKHKLSNAKIVQAFQQSRLNRLTKLRQSRGVSQEALERCQSEFDQANLAIKTAETELKLSEARLKKHTLTCPPGFVVAEKFVEPGEWVSPGQPLYKVIDLRQIKFAIGVRGADLPRLRAGYTTTKNSIQATVTLGQTEATQSIPLKLHRIAPQSDPKTRRFWVEFVAANPSTQIAAGISAQLTLEQQNTGTETLLPARALVKVHGLWLVYKIVDNHAVPHPVEHFERRTDALIAIPELKAGEIFVGKGADFIVAGAKVQISPN